MENKLNSERETEVGTFKVSDLFNALSVSIEIPDYQRPYVWNKQHIEELINDWQDHFFINNEFVQDKIDYYLGTIMLQRKNQSYLIIDGQQRLTTLLIMDYVWNEDNSVLKKSEFKFSYKSNVSIQRIIENKSFLIAKHGSLISAKFNQIIEKLVFSIVITNSEDSAFVFFESQNNRGVPLDEVDFFKSFHLRELKTNIVLLKHFAKKFDQLNSNSRSNRKFGIYQKNLNELFIKQFWIIRHWSKNRLTFPNRKNLLNTFQKHTVSFGNNEEVKLYPSANNSLGTSLSFNHDMKPTIQSIIRLYGAESIDIPFAINQPIQRGVGFFLFTEKYSELNTYIFIDKKVKELNPINELVKNVFNSYFINFYQSTIIQYYDKFGNEKIDVFAKLLEHFLGAFRMNRASIVEQSPIVLLRDYGNIMLEIQQSYLCEEVINFLKKIIPHNFYEGYKYDHKEENRYYILNARDNKKITPVRQNYYEQVSHFYREFIQENNFQLNQKHNWINASINK
jgi:hypothetical protein